MLIFYCYRIPEFIFTDSAVFNCVIRSKANVYIFYCLTFTKVPVIVSFFNNFSLNTVDLKMLSMFIFKFFRLFIKDIYCCCFKSHHPKDNKILGTDTQILVTFFISCVSSDTLHHRVFQRTVLRIQAVLGSSPYHRNSRFL